MDRKDLHDIVNLVTIASGMAKKSLESLENIQSSEVEDAKTKLTKSLNALSRLENLISDLRNIKSGNSEIAVNTDTQSKVIEAEINQTELVEKKTILIVDDESDIRELLMEELSNKNFNMITANDGREGFTQFIQHKPDLVISDINMPHLSGIEMAQLIYNKNQNVKFILLGGDIDEQKILNLPYASAVKLMNKPFDFDLLNVHIKNFLKAS